VTLISGIVDGLKDDSRLSDIADEFIYYGPEPNIPHFPAITVELRDAEEEWKTFPQGKDVVATFVVRIFDEAYDYVTGLQSVEAIAQNVSDVLQAEIGFSGLVYMSTLTNKSFAVYQFDNVPVFGCEMELETKKRFAPASS